jgi:antitoxin (DNA-binding transcriptional repressor) of toxin-antitoxin stability system
LPRSYLAKVQEGVEIVVEKDYRPVAVIKTPQGAGRLILKAIVLAGALLRIVLDSSGASSRRRNWRMESTARTPRRSVNAAACLGTN